MRSPTNIPNLVTMITYVIGDIFRSPAKVLVNTVNTKGVMGKGLAKDFKALYPEMFSAYQRLCESKRFDIGQLHLFKTPNKWILNFPTKKDWKQPSRPEYIEAGLKAFVAGCGKANIPSIAFPQLGCGHGELNWEEEVRPLMERHLSKISIPVYIHLYKESVFPKEHQDLEGTKAWLHGEPESLGFREVLEDLQELIANTPRGRTPDGKYFDASIVDETDGQVLRFAGPNPVFISEETLMDVWQYFRSVGFLSADSLPETLAPHADQLLALLGRLPYVSQVEIARGRTSSETKFGPALQLMPRPANDEPLFQVRPEAVVHA